MEAAVGIAVLVLLIVGPKLRRAWRRQRRGEERAQLAASRGWQFADSDERLLTRWRGEPFSRRGDNREAFGVISGSVDDIPFTAFDYRRRTVHVVGSQDEYETITVWVLRLPEPLPAVEVKPGHAGRMKTVPTGDPEFDRRFLVSSAHAETVQWLFNPEVTAWLREHKLPDWRIEGQDLLHWRENYFRRTKPAQVAATAESLAGLAARLPTVQQRYDQPNPPPR
jgi:hypothetical protein